MGWNCLSIPNFNFANVEIWECITNFITPFTGRMIAYPCWDWSGAMLLYGSMLNSWYKARDRLINYQLPFLSFQTVHVRLSSVCETGKSSLWSVSFGLWIIYLYICMYIYWDNDGMKESIVELMSIRVMNLFIHIPDRKAHGANMGPTWVLSAPDGPHVGPMNLAIRDHTHGWVTVTTNRSYHQPRWRRPKTVRPNNRGYQENLTVRCAHMTLTCRCHITLCISAMTMCFSSAGSENLHLEIFRKLVVTVRPCWS